MKRSKQFLTVLLLAMVLGSWCEAEERAENKETISGSVTAVTLYRDRALVTREIEVPAGQAVRMISVEDLPQSVVADSVYADGDAEIQIRAVRVSPHVTVESNRAEVRELEEQSETLQKQRLELQLTIDGFTDDLKTLEKMVGLSAELGRSDLERGVLKANTLIELSDYSMTKRRELAAERLKLQQQLNEIEKEIGQLAMKKDIATKGKRTTNYHATIFIEGKPDTAGTVRLSYLVSNCGWEPQYTVRGSTEQDNVELRYSALVQQMSGESWSDVKLTLSTASPSVSAARPGLTPLRVASADPTELNAYVEAEEDNPFAEDVQADRTAMLAHMIESLRDQQLLVEAQLDSNFGGIEPEARDAALNGLAGHMQEIELQAEAESWRTMAPDLENDFASHVYEIPASVSLDSRRENQLVQIVESDLKCEMYHVATPLLSSYAYREAKMTNTEPIGLLQGPANVYLNDRFVGRMQIPTTASGQRLVVGFGADQQVRTRRELVDKFDQLQGGNRQLKFAYRLVISNFKDKPVNVRLVDRMPSTRQAHQLSVSLDPPEMPLSEDGLYTRMERPTGMLRWDLEVPGGQHGSDAFDVNYSFSMEFDRNRIPTMQHALANLQAEFDAKYRTRGGGFGGGLGGGQFSFPNDD